MTSQPTGPVGRGLEVQRHSRLHVESLAGLEDEELLTYINDWEDERSDPDN